MKQFVFLALVLPGVLSAEPLPRADAEFAEPVMAQVLLGRQLFFDPILSGNKTVACATCHHTRLGTTDRISLGLGDGASGLGPDRKADATNPPEQRIPRNSPALFNLGASEFVSLFHDGRLQADPSQPSGIRTPLGDDMEPGFASVLSAQTMFPVLSGDEMAGHYSENDVAQAVRQGFLTGENGAWAILSKRVADIPEYRTAFDPVIGAQTQLHFSDISNAIAAFIGFEWRADNSPFDQYLRDGIPLSDDAVKGMALFYGKANCATCHSGQFQTDHQFHAIAMPQIGPGKAARFESHHRDEGRARVTADLADLYRFRTPSLRNVTATAPYGHSGAYATLEAVVRHHLNPVIALRSYDTSQAIWPALEGSPDFVVMADKAEVDRIAAANALEPVSLRDSEIKELMAFLEALTDPVARLGVPLIVPSDLPVDQ